MIHFLKKLRRKRLRSRPFPEPWRKIIEAHVPYYRFLGPEDQTGLQGIVQVLLNEKKFEGCGGLEMTDEIRVTIAAHAAILLLHLDHDYYPGLQSVVVYPSSYIAQIQIPGPTPGTTTEGEETRFGQASRETIVLAWDAVRHAATDFHGGNIVLHEFAHQLDQQDGRSADGAPLLRGTSHYVSWARILGGEYENLTHSVANRQSTLLDPYGATNPAEFFAVATEAFFENPVLLRDEHPKLYEELKSFYRQDPAAVP